MNTLIQLIVIALKFLIPASMLVFPVFGAWGNYILDVIDGDLLQQFGMNEYTYQTIDKLADFVSYIFMLILGWRWSIRKTILGLFIYRTIGQVLFFITRDEMMFFYFQNFLEPLVMIYVLLIWRQRSETKAYKTYKKHFILIWAIILGYKLWNEWYLHFANIDLSTMFFGFNGGNI